MGFIRKCGYFVIGMVGINKVIAPSRRTLVTVKNGARGRIWVLGGNKVISLLNLSLVAASNGVFCGYLVHSIICFYGKMWDGNGIKRIGLFIGIVKK